MQINKDLFFFINSNIYILWFNYTEQLKKRPVNIVLIYLKLRYQNYIVVIVHEQCNV